MNNKEIITSIFKYVNWSVGSFFVQTFLLPIVVLFHCEKAFQYFSVLLCYLYPSPRFSLSSSPPPFATGTTARFTRCVRRNVVFERIKLLVKMNFDRLNKLLLCLKISRLENNGVLDNACFVASISRRRGEKRGRKKRGEHEIGTFQPVWLPRVLRHPVWMTSASSKRGSFRSLYKLCNLYSAATSTSTLFLAKNFFHYVSSAEIILKRKKKERKK